MLNLRLRWFAVWPLVMAVTGCGGSGDEVPVPKEDTGIPLPENGVQIQLPPLEIPAGSERQLCWYTTFPHDDDVWVNGYDAFQGPGGHHIIAFETSDDVPDGTVIDCTDGKAMAAWLPLLLATEVTGLDLPDGYGIRVKGKTKLVIQTHYINTSTQPAEVHDTLNINFNQTQDGVIGVAPYASSVLDFAVPPLSQQLVEYECTAPQDMEVFALLGHLHEWGSSLSVRAGASTDTMTNLYDYPQWDPGWRDTPPVRKWDVDAPFHLAQGDKVRVECGWNNTTTHELTFPEEMCAALFWFYPAESTLVCDADVVSTQ